MDSCRVPTNIYIDISKAFDTPNHGILLQKLKYYGITRNSINLLQSYLSEQCQYVEYNHHRSNTLPISTGAQCGKTKMEKTKMDNFLLFNIWGIYLVENTLNYH